MLSLFRESELELVRHYFTSDVQVTLPMGRLGVEKAVGPDEVIALLADRIMGPNQIMKSVKPMPVNEKFIESRTVVVRDELPASHASIDAIKEALKREGHESDSDDDSETLGSDEGSAPTVKGPQNGAANPNEPGDDGSMTSDGRGGDKSLDGFEDETPERLAMRSEFMKRAKLEVREIMWDIGIPMPTLSYVTFAAANSAAISNAANTPPFAARFARRRF